VVRHEMLHAILDNGNHPLAYFADRCDGTVDFDPPKDVGVIPVAAIAARTIPATSALTVTIEPYPATPRVSQYNGLFAYVIKARNTSGGPVWINLSDGFSGEYVDDNGIGTYLPVRNRRVFFAAGQERRAILDGYADTAGTYHVYASYGTARSKRTAVAVLP
jgi:hypothetical protein